MAIFAMSGVVLLAYMPNLRGRFVLRNLKQQYLHTTSNLDTIQLSRYYGSESRVKKITSLKDSLQIPIPENGKASDIKIEKEDLARQVEISVSGIATDYFYDDPLTGNMEGMESMCLENMNGKAKITIVCSKVVEIKRREDDTYVYLDFLTPHEVYDKVVVIDAGHGDRATGAVSNGVAEKDVNLAVLKRLKKKFADQKKIGVYCTRTKDVNPTSKARLGLAEATDADLIVSIHCNSMDNEKFSYIHGTEVLYQQSEKEEGMTSKAFAQICQEEVTAGLGSVNRGIVPASDDVEIVKQANATVALIELGFLTNEQERIALTQKDYQDRAAEAIYKAILRGLEEAGTESE